MSMRRTDVPMKPLVYVLILIAPRQWVFENFQLHPRERKEDGDTPAVSCRLALRRVVSRLVREPCSVAS